MASATAIHHARLGKKTLIVTTDRHRTSFVLYPESTPIMESWRAMQDLKEAGINTQLVVANLVLPEEACVNAFFRNRRAMQVKYLREIRERFDLPVLQFPMMQEEISGLGRLKQAAAFLSS